MDQLTDGQENGLTKPLHNVYLMYFTSINPYLMKFALFSAILVLWGRTNEWTDGGTDGRTKPHIEMHGSI